MFSNDDIKNEHIKYVNVLIVAMRYKQHVTSNSHSNIILGPVYCCNKCATNINEAEEKCIITTKRPKL